MPHVFPAYHCAPYSVFVSGRLAGRAPDLVSLHDLLFALHAKWKDERARLTEARARARCEEVFLRPLPEYPRPQVIDARGVERPEFISSHRLLWFFGCSRNRLANAIDHGWDGDVRPRGEPVPGTGQRVRSVSHYYRRPATQSQRRQVFVIEEDGEPEFRGARRLRALPTYWDDQPRRSGRDRNWKGFRATQWKA